MLKDVPLHSDMPAYFVRERIASGLTIAVVGCGYWGSKHVRVLSAMADVKHVIVVEPDAGVRSKMLAAFPNADGASALEDVLERVDGVVIATPPHNHTELALLALKAGRHVLVEKPLATNARDARRIVAAGRASGAQVVAGHTYEFNPVVHDLRRRMEEGELGDIKYIHSARLNLGLYRSDVNVVWDLAPHDISIMNYLLGETPKTARAWGFSCASKGVVDVAHFQLEYRRSGVVGYGFTSWIDPRKIRQLTIVGSKKMAVYDDVAEEKLRIYDHHVELPPGYGEGMAPNIGSAVSYRRGDVISPNIEFREPLLLENQYFVDCILGRNEQRQDGQNGLDVVRVLEAIDSAMENGKPVSIKGGTANLN